MVLLGLAAELALVLDLGLSSLSSIGKLTAITATVVVGCLRYSSGRRGLGLFPGVIGRVLGLPGA